MAVPERISDYPEYNYPHFIAGPDDVEFEKFRNTLHVGETAPDFELLRLDDRETVRLRDYTAERDVVVEFGSYT